MFLKNELNHARAREREREKERGRERETKGMTSREERE